MIGKSLNARYKLSPLADDTARSVLASVLADQAEPLVKVRAADAHMIACLFVRADKEAVRLCRELGVEMRPQGTGVVGLLGSDAANFFGDLTNTQKAWLKVPCARRETKVVLIARGIALLSLETDNNEVRVTTVA